MNRPEKEIRDWVEMEGTLREAEIGRLGTCAGGEPYVVPLNFAYDNGKIVFHCAGRGRKLENITENSRVCFEVDNGQVMQADEPCGFSFRYRSVIAYGEARVHTDPRKMVEALNLLVEKYALGMSGRLTAEAVSRYENLAVVEITVDEMTGKRNPL